MKKVAYIIFADKNILYEGKFLLNGRYRTYGQHSFILDFLRCISRQGQMDVDVLIRGMDVFPIAAALSREFRVNDLPEIGDLARYDLLLLDEVDDDFPRLLPCVRTFCLVHNARRIYPPHFVGAVDKFICMSLSSYARQSSYIDRSRLEIAVQGIDLNRFVPNLPDSLNTGHLLVYSRLDGLKQQTMVDVLERLADTLLQVTVVGDGASFWPLSDRFGERYTIINFIPCHSIQQFLPRFGTIISSGRGVLEGLACGIPTICAGLGYGGVVTKESFSRLQGRNFTGYEDGPVPDSLQGDIDECSNQDSGTCRRLVEAGGNMEQMVAEIMEIAHNS